MSCEAMVLHSSCLSSRSEARTKVGNRDKNQKSAETNLRSKFDPRLNSTSRYPVAEVIQIRSLDGTEREEKVSGRAGAEEKETKRTTAVNTIKRLRLVGRCGG